MILTKQVMELVWKIDLEKLGIQTNSQEQMVNNFSSNLQ